MVTKVPISENPRGITIYAVLWPLTGVSGIFLALRIYSKTLRRRALWWDDYFIIVSWILLLLSCCTTTTNVLLGFGLHTHQIPIENFSVFGIISNISGFASVLSVVCSKTSFAITLLRLTGQNVCMRWFIYGLLALLNITHYLAAVFFWVSCNPPAKTYYPMMDGECWPVQFTINFGIVVGACSAFCDFALALLPWRLLLRYNMYNREKIGVAVAMSMGILAGITCIVKLTTIPVLGEGDFSYNSLPLVLWGFIEPACTIMAASIPMLRHLFKNLRHSSDDDSARVGTNLHYSSSSPLGDDPAERRRRRHMDLPDDNCSDRSIIAPPVHQGPGRSTHTLGTTITTSEKSDSGLDTNILPTTISKKRDKAAYEMVFMRAKDG